VLHLLSVLKAQSESWGTQFPETMRNCLLALASTGWTLLEVEPLLTNASFRAQVLSQVSDVQVRGFFTRFDAMGKHNQLAYSQPVLNKITPLLSVPAIRNVLGQKRSLSFRDLIDEHPGMAVLVALGVDRLHDASHLVGGLFLSSFQSAVMSRADQPEADRVPVHLYVDEFENLATDRFHQIVSEGRRLGLGLTLSHQNITQLAPEMRHALRNNVRTQAYFQTGAQDAAELVKEIGGKNREEVRQCLMRQETGEAFLVRRGQAPTRMKVRLCPDPVVDASRVDALRSASAQTYARPVAEVERELEDRFNDLAGLHVSNSASDGATKGSPSKYEILDAKAESFPPRKTATNTAASGKAEPRAEGTAPTKRPPKKVAPRKTSKTKADRTDDNAG
jgi:hypothetical protein